MTARGSSPWPAWRARTRHYRLGQQVRLQLLAAHHCHPGGGQRRQPEDGRRSRRWEPLINTPNYPDHTSGATIITGAFTRTLSLFFRTDEFTFTLSSTFPLAIQKEREYHRFSDAAEDVVNVRIYQGIHFRTADEAGRKQGQRVAKWVFLTS